MQHSIPISKYQIGNTTVNAASAKEVHAQLGIAKDFSNWIKAQIKRAELEENFDYIKVAQKGELSKTGQTFIDYILTLDSAKHIAMMSQSKKAKAVRDYFIEVEKKYIADLEARANQQAVPTSPTFTKYDFVLVVFYLYHNDDLDVDIARVNLPSVEKLTKRYNNSLYRRTTLTQEKIQKLVLDKLLAQGLILYVQDGQGYFYSNYSYGQILSNLDLDSYAAELQLIRQRPQSEVVQYVDAQVQAPERVVESDTTPAPSTATDPQVIELVSVNLVLDLLEMQKKHNLPTKTINQMIKQQSFVKKETSAEQSINNIKKTYRENHKRWDSEKKLLVASVLVKDYIDTLKEELKAEIDSKELINYMLSF